MRNIVNITLKTRWVNINIKEGKQEGVKNEYILQNKYEILTHTLKKYSTIKNNTKNVLYQEGTGVKCRKNSEKTQNSKIFICSESKP